MLNYYSLKLATVYCYNIYLHHNTLYTSININTLSCQFKCPLPFSCFIILRHQKSEYLFIIHKYRSMKISDYIPTMKIITHGINSNKLTCFRMIAHSGAQVQNMLLVTTARPALPFLCPLLLFLLSFMCN